MEPRHAVQEGDPGHPPDAPPELTDLYVETWTALRDRHEGNPTVAEVEEELRLLREG